MKNQSQVALVPETLKEFNPSVTNILDSYADKGVRLKELYR